MIATHYLQALKIKNFLTILFLSFVTIVSSQNNLDENTTKTKDTVQQKEGILVGENLTKALKPIRENFKKVNTIENWTKIKTVALWESAEGGEAKYYYRNEKLEKIITHNFGETAQWLTEYYLKDSELSFVFEKHYKYNSPFYWTKEKAEESPDDTEAFDFEKSEITEDRSYFSKGKLIHRLNNKDCCLPSTSEYILKEQKRVTSKFDKLITLEKAK